MSAIERIKESNRYWRTFRYGFEAGAQAGFKEAISAVKIQNDTLKLAIHDGVTKEEIKEIMDEMELFLNELRFIGKQ